MSRIIKKAEINDRPVVINCMQSAVPESEVTVPIQNRLSASPRDYEADPQAKAEFHAKVQTEAKAKADSYLEQKRHEIEQKAAELYEESRQSGYNNGFAEGQESGYQAGFDQGKQAVEQAMQENLQAAANQASRILSAASRQSQEAVLAAERQIVDIALSMARKILQYEINENSEAVLSIVKAAMDKVKNQEQITIRISAADFETVISAKRELEAILQREQSIEFIADQTVGKGGCVIDCAFGAVDARFETQIQTLEAAIKGMIP